MLELECFMYKYKSLQAGQLQREHSSFLQNLLNFIIAKYLKQEVDDHLRVLWMNTAPKTSQLETKIYKCHVTLS